VNEQCGLLAGRKKKRKNRHERTVNEASDCRTSNEGKLHVQVPSKRKKEENRKKFGIRGRGGGETKEVFKGMKGRGVTKLLFV